MRNAEQIILELQSNGIKLWVEDGKLRYRAPKGVLTATLRSEVRKHKTQILSLLNQSVTQSIARGKIQKVSRSNVLPLSFAQQRLWFLDQLNSSIAYNMPAALNLSGPLNVAALQESLQEVVRRHESLRTTFAMDENRPRQVIHPEMSIDLPVVDLCAYGPQQQALEVKRLSVAEATRPFDLSRDAMLRATLLRLSAPNRMDTQHLLLLTRHHIAWDGWSLGVLVRELAALYKAFSQGQPSPLPELPIQYADFAVWQREYLQGEVLAQQLAYWKERLAGAPPLLQLPTDRARPAEQSFLGDVVQIEIEADLTNALRRLSKEHGVTLYMTLLAAFQVLMSRHSGQTDVVVASPIANRNRQEIEPLIGFFVNTLALRADLEGADGQPPSVSELLAQVKETTEAAYDHQDLPFERLVEELHLTRNLNYNPLVQVLFVLQNAPMDDLHLPGLTVTPAEVEGHTTPFDLEMHVREVDNQLPCYCIYSTDLFDKRTIERMMRHFQTLLAGMVADPLRSIAELPLLTEAERHQILVEWNDTVTDYPSECIHQLFEQQVKRTPSAIALVFADQAVTYHELNARANQLAHYLIAQGVGPDVLVAICLPRSIEMVVGLLGILKAGGAYVPLDPNYPNERLQFMLQDAKVKVLLTTSQLLGAGHDAFTVCLDHLLPMTELTNPHRNHCSKQLAYVLYTSGSTGRPKGVAIEHRSPVALLSWAHTIFGPEELAGVLASTSISFDLSVFELFLPLSLGGTVILAENALHLPNLPAKNQVTLINTVPSAITELVKIGGIPRSVLVVNLAGEPLKESLVRQIYRQETIQKVYNLYGPSEDTTYSTFTLVERGAKVTIGRPIANTQAYILDQHLTPVPIGVPGELYLGGAGLAREYLNRPTLTDERFIANPFGEGRLYKTGDLVRYQRDSNIDFLGRADYQVKIRGFRIELGEIEAVLNSQPNVHEAIVVVHEDSSGSKADPDKRLVAYVVGEVKGLRAQLTQKLPDYMIPSVFVPLEAMPLTPNGKIDRRALPTPTSHLQVETTYVAPQNEIEREIVQVWQEVLTIEKVGVHDNFFELGGHSLLIIQLHSRLQKMYEEKLAISDLFKYPTVSALAAHLSKSIGIRISKQPDSIREQDRAEFRHVRRAKGRQQRQLRQKSRRR